MLETEIKKLTAAIEAHTLALQGGAPAMPVQPASAPVAAPAASQAPDHLPPTVTKKQIVEGVVRLAKGKNRETAAALLAEYGAQKVPDLDVAKYPEFLAKIEAILAS
jgi:hypothetical protein